MQFWKYVQDNLKEIQEALQGVRNQDSTSSFGELQSELQEDGGQKGLDKKEDHTSIKNQENEEDVKLNNVQQNQAKEDSLKDHSESSAISESPEEQDSFENGEKNADLSSLSSLESDPQVSQKDKQERDEGKKSSLQDKDVSQIETSLQSDEMSQASSQASSFSQDSLDTPKCDIESQPLQSSQSGEQGQDLQEQMSQNPNEEQQGLQDMHQGKTEDLQSQPQDSGEVNSSLSQDLKQEDSSIKQKKDKVLESGSCQPSFSEMSKDSQEDLQKKQTQQESEKKEEASLTHDSVQNQDSEIAEDSTLKMGQKQRMDSTKEKGSHREEHDESKDTREDLGKDAQDKDDLEKDLEEKENFTKNGQEEHDASLEEIEQRKKMLQQLRDRIEEYSRKKRIQEERIRRKLDKSRSSRKKEKKEKSQEEKYELSEHTNQFLEQLRDLPSFKDRDRGAGYAIDTDGYTELPDSLVRTLITKFLNQRFCKRATDLNIRSNSLEKAKGFQKWEVKDVIVHLETKQVTKVLNDKYGYEYANGKNENVPLSFYFDMSGSMSAYTNMLAVIAIELLKKNVKVLLGFNERVNVQIESIQGNIDVATLASILQSAGYLYSSSRKNFIKDSRVKFKFIDRNLDNYLIEKKAEKCVVFSDFDPLREVAILSKVAEVYWFCFESNFEKVDIRAFNGFIYKVQDAKGIANGLVKVNENRFEVLCYVDNPKVLQKKR